MTIRAEPFSPLPIEKFSKIVDACVSHDPWFHDGFADDVVLKRHAVIAHLSDAFNHGKLWECWRDTELVGVLLLNEVVPFIDARCHFLFFDAKLSDKADLCQTMMGHAFDTVPVETLRVEIPTYARALLKFIRGKLGFRFEAEDRVFRWPATADRLDADAARLGSRKHNATKYKGEWCDVLLLSITRDEFVARKEQHGSENDQTQSGQSAGAHPTRP